MNPHIDMIARTDKISLIDIISVFASHRYRPHLPIDYIQTILAYSGPPELVKLLTEMEVIYAANDKGKIDCKLTQAKFGNT